MRSPTVALLWDIWRRHRWMIVLSLVLASAGRLVEFVDRDGSVLVGLLKMASFLCVFGASSYTDTSGSRAGGFPERLFLLPVSTRRLVAVPMLAGITAIELLKLLWWSPSLVIGDMSEPFAAVLLGAAVILCQTCLWTLARLGPLRLVILGVGAVGLFAIGLLPSLAPTPPPAWRTEFAMSLYVLGLMAVAAMLAFTHLASVRSGGGPRRPHTDRLVAFITAMAPVRRTPFRSAAAAHFWFDWRSAGVVLPLLTAAVLVIVGPLSWVVRHDADDTLQVLAWTLAAPILLAMPVGTGFAKPAFWSDDLAIPAFVAVRPLSDEDLIATRLRVAAASAGLAWLLLVAFVTVWLTCWANLDAISRLAIAWWAFHDQSIAAVVAMPALVVTCGALLTWRLLVVRLWSGLSGYRPLRIASAISIGVTVVAAMAFDADRFPRWVLGDPARMVPVVRVLSVAVVAKYWLAAYAWRRASPAATRRLLTVWAVGTACLLLLALVLWDVVRIYVALDIYRFQAVLVLAALLAMPLARLGLAPTQLARNRHR